MGVALTPLEAVTAYLAALGTGDADAVADLVSAEFVNEHTSALGETLHGRETYRARLVRFLTDFSDLHYEAEMAIVDDSHVAVPYRMTATWVGSSGDRHPISLRGMFHFEVVDGEITRRVDYWDSSEFLRQTGRR